MLPAALRKRALIVVGKGGVGRTSVAGALAIARSRETARVLALEYDRMGALAATFGRRPSLEAIEAAAPGVWTSVLDGAHQLEEYLATVVPSRTMLKAIVGSGAYRYFVEAAPGLRELITIGKIYHELEHRPPSPPWDCIVLDAPASGQALSVLRMPIAARETFGAAIAGFTADRVSELLRDPGRCGVALVTSPEPFAVSETIETHAALKALGMEVTAVIFNRMRTPRFDARAVTRLARRASAASPGADILIALAQGEIRRAGDERRAVRLVRRRIPAPVIELAEQSGMSGPDLVRKLAGELSNQGLDARGSAPARPV
jgi:anion-transporting  ArsA/GET3 family ATPase